MCIFRFRKSLSFAILCYTDRRGKNLSRIQNDVCASSTIKARVLPAQHVHRADHCGSASAQKSRGIRGGTNVYNLY